jgi:hypothetical protein
LLDVLNSERFAACSPYFVYATFPDEGRYFGSVRTLYRALGADGQSVERRRQRMHPVYTKPELLATAPNQVWSWDITKLKGPAKWTNMPPLAYSRADCYWTISNIQPETGLGCLIKHQDLKTPYLFFLVLFLILLQNPSGNPV